MTGTNLENKSIVQTIIDAARDPNKVLEFNYASEALNNSFFLESLVRSVPLLLCFSSPSRLYEETHINLPCRPPYYLLYHVSDQTRIRNPLLRTRRHMKPPSKDRT